MYIVDISSKAYRIVKKFKGEEKVEFENLVEKLKTDPFNKKLKTHKLSGLKEEVWSCRLNYSDRVLFIFIQEDHLIIVDIGNHDNVY